MRASVFPTATLALAGTSEEVIVGGRDKFKLLPEALEGVKQIGFIGWGSQGPSQAQNFRDSLAAIECKDIVVKVGLQAGSASFEKAAQCGFTKENGTAGEMYEIIRESDLVIVLIADAGQTYAFQEIQAAMKRGATLGLSHGFLIGYMETVGANFRSDIDVVGVCPKGMGPSLRRLYEQGKEGNAMGAGINASYAVHQDYTGDAKNIALAWAVAIGSPYVFPTTLEMEYRSDIFGERGVLLGGVWGISEALYSHFLYTRSRRDYAAQLAFIDSAMNITGPITKGISEGGLLGLASLLPKDARPTFFLTLKATYDPAKALLAAIYDEVQSGREIAGVVSATNRLKQYPMSRVDGSPMWRTGQAVRADKSVRVELDPTTAGVYVGIMMAQIDILQENGHGWSEICNETIIEAVDSLNPYIAARGIDYMVDNCSTTARLGARKWGPLFAQMVTGDVLPKANIAIPDLDKIAPWFEAHPVHAALAECMKMRPAVSIAVT
jgi:ketol-acid reductoisomerase